MTQLVVHLGYPKTATTTFQQHVFPRHPEIEYLGKLIPSFRYRDERLFTEVDQLMTVDSLRYGGVGRLRQIVEEHRSNCDRPVLLVSSESFLHITAADPGIVAERIKAAFAPCKIIITLREQRDMLRSFYGLHGRFGQYLFLCKWEMERLPFPLSLDEWLSFCFRAADKNYPSMLHYHEVVKRYRQLFGADNVGVLLFEELRSAPTSFVEKMFGFMGADAVTATALMGDHKENESLSRTEWAWMRLSQVARKRRIGDTMERRSQSTLYQWLSRTANKLDTTLPPHWEQRLNDWYGSGNRALANELGLPLRDYGYAGWPSSEGG